MWNFKQYLNYILIIINQKILRVFLNLQKRKKKKIYTKQTSTAATTDFLSKFPDAKKMSNEHFNLCDTEMS